MVDDLLSSSLYVYRLVITDVSSEDERPLIISQIKYFNEYKSLLDGSDHDQPMSSMDVRIPITYIRLTYNVRILSAIFIP